jgi:hypothetical protein
MLKELIQQDLDTLRRAEEKIAKAAYADVMSDLLRMEKQLTKDIRAMDKEIEKGDKDEIKKTRANQKVLKETLKDTQTTIAATMKTAPEKWVETWAAPSYIAGRKQLEISLTNAQLVGYNTRPLLLAHEALFMDPATLTPIKASGFRTRAAYNAYGKELQDWLAYELNYAYQNGIPIGNYKDIGTGKNTLTANLFKDDSRFRGYTTASGVHVPAERNALATARIEPVQIANDVAWIESNELGLTHCYNSNPDDVNTTKICQEATHAGALVKGDMIKRYGQPPRLSPFHLCRSSLIYVMEEWISDVKELKVAA